MDERGENKEKNQRKKINGPSHLPSGGQITHSRIERDPRDRRRDSESAGVSHRKSIKEVYISPIIEDLRLREGEE